MQVHFRYKYKYCLSYKQVYFFFFNLCFITSFSSRYRLIVSSPYRLIPCPHTVAGPGTTGISICARYHRRRRSSSLLIFPPFHQSVIPISTFFSRSPVFNILYATFTYAFSLSFYLCPGPFSRLPRERMKEERNDVHLAAGRVLNKDELPVCQLLRIHQHFNFKEPAKCNSLESYW